ncbi:TolC family protein [Roseateles sp. BYS180W]|uniref:TolC family protein n=1 Tax=Roseateles rivi TaxID=3299028 RepID=A0ABW7FX68_9BURK
MQRPSLPLRHGARLCPLALACALLLGCSSVPKAPPAPPSPPAHWLHGSPEAPRATPVVDAQLAQLQQRALLANLDLARAALRLQAARSRQLDGDRRWLQEASLNAQDTRQRPGANTQTFSAQASLSYELDLFGRLAAGARQRSLDVSSQERDAQALRTQLLADVAQAYWQWQGLQAQAPLQAERLEDLQAVLAMTRISVAAGRLAPVEVDKVATQIQEQQLQLQQRQREQQQLQLRLGVLLGEGGAGPQLQPVPLPDVALAGLPLAEPARVLELRADVAQARIQVDQALAGWAEARGQRYPRLTFSAAYGTQGTRPGDWLDNPLRSLVSKLTVPLVQWQHLAAQEDQAQLKLQEQALALRDTLNKAVLDVEGALLDYRGLREELAVQQQRVQEVLRTERDAQRRRELGMVSGLDWRQVRAARLQAELATLQLQQRIWVQQTTLHRALGLPLQAGN